MRITSSSFAHLQPLRRNRFGSANTCDAISKSMLPCFFRFDRFFCASHTKRMRYTKRITQLLAIADTRRRYLTDLPLDPIRGRDRFVARRRSTRSRSADLANSARLPGAPLVARHKWRNRVCRSGANATEFDVATNRESDLQKRRLGGVSRHSGAIEADRSPNRCTNTRRPPRRVKYWQHDPECK